MQLSVHRRDTTKKIKHLRSDGFVPAVVYGKHLHDAQSLVLSKLEFLRVFEKSGKSTPIEVT